MEPSLRFSSRQMPWQPAVLQYAHRRMRTAVPVRADVIHFPGIARGALCRRLLKRPNSMNFACSCSVAVADVLTSSHSRGWARARGSRPACPSSESSSESSSSEEVSESRPLEEVSESPSEPESDEPGSEDCWEESSAEVAHGHAPNEARRECHRDFSRPARRPVRRTLERTRRSYSVFESADGYESNLHRVRIC